MKIQTYDHCLVWDLVEHLRKKGLSDETSGYIRFLLEDNIPMKIRIDGVLYSAPWRYWEKFTTAHATCCGACCDDTIKDVEIAKKELIKNSIVLKDGAIDF